LRPTQLTVDSLTPQVKLLIFGFVVTGSFFEFAAWEELQQL
jgi:hypothetical protein